ncbi:MAG: hypothetical protein IT452_03860 [Planctomycetia bacterium]|nr:hypothetical protein [Planctomycetia bacterium]
MRSQVRFAMHPEDECEFVKEVLRDPAVVLLDGPRWKTSSPTTFRSLENIGFYCIIWSPEDRPLLSAEFIPTCNDYYCNSEYATIQFLRSSMHKDQILTQGRIAISTTGSDKEYFDPRSGERVDSRFKRLRKFIRKNYSNSAVQWLNPDFPIAAATNARSANPSEPDASFWVGPSALNWMGEREGRIIKQAVSFRTEARLVK